MQASCLNMLKHIISHLLMTNNNMYMYALIVHFADIYYRTDVKTL